MLLVASFFTVNIMFTPMFTHNPETNSGGTHKPTPYSSKNIAPSKRIPNTASDLELSASGGEEPIKMDLLGDDGKFEKNQSNGAPFFKDTGHVSGQGSSNVNETYADITYAGNYAMNMVSIGTEQFEATSRATYYFSYSLENRPYLNESQTLSFHYRLSNMAGQQSYLWLQVQFRGESSYYYLYYLFWYKSTYTNYTTSKYILLNTTQMNTWINFQHNLTKDFESSFGVSAQDIYVRSIQFQFSSDRGVSNPLQLVLDDVSMANKTNYEFVTEGDFEDPNTEHWSKYTSSSSYAYLSTDHVEGNYALNMTSTAINGSPATTSLYYYNNYPDGYYPKSPNQTILSLYWKYSDVENGGGQSAFLEIQLRNETSYYHVIYVLGTDNNDTTNYYNSTYSTVFFSPYFGVRNQWHHEYIDIFDLVESSKFYNQVITEFYFSVTSGNHKNGTAQLLLDDIKFISYPFGDPGFEITESSGSYPIYSWRTTGTSTYLGYSTIIYSGNNTANITAEGNYAGITRTMYSGLKIEKSIFLDVAWRIENISGVSGTYAAITLHFDGGYTLDYVLGSGDSFESAFSNYSSTSYIKVKNYNVTGEWHVLTRNIYYDLYSSFGAKKYNLTSIVIPVNTGSGKTITLLIDEVNLIKDTHAPQISSLRIKNSPDFQTPAIIEVNVTDALSPITQVLINYSTENTTGTINSTKIVTGSYLATMPVFPFNTRIRFTINVTDYASNWKIYDNSTHYYSYVSWDYETPQITIQNLNNYTIIKDTINITYVTTDTGSGIKFVLFYANTTLIGNTTSTTHYVWDSRTISNGTYYLKAIAYDLANNQKESETIIITINNDHTAPIISSVVINPKNPQYFDNVTVIVGIIDNTGVTEVNLYYKTNETGNYQKIAMSKTDFFYNAIIPQQPWNTVVKYYVEAIDVYGLKSTRGTAQTPLSFTVGDMIPPVLAVNAPPTESILSGTVNIEIKGNDPGSGIKNITITLDGKAIKTITTPSTTIAWDTTSVENGKHTLKIIVYDNAENNASISYNYEIQNPKGIAKLFSNTEKTLTEHGIITGIVISILGYALITLLIKKIIKKKPTT